MGLFFGRPESNIVHWAIAIITITAFINFMSAALIKRYPSKASLIRNWRVSINYSFNVWLIYMLFPYWSEIWMLLLLMVITVAIYDSLEATCIYCFGFGFVLLYIAYLQNQFAGLQLGQTLMHVATLALMGPFINRLVHLSRASGAAERQKERSSKAA
jgi:hypothetical protein